MKSFIKVMKALSDPSRVKILKMLQKKHMCVCELRAVLKLAQPTVSKHLKILEEAGLVESEKDKLWVNYLLAKQPESPYAATMLVQLKKWLNDEKSIEEIYRILPTIDRIEVCKL
ncbi:MAG: metalloregulator ArsR/SmtB family transcription factor [Desulfobulbaceae bacterium]|nr:metalloregulator ArsR/SmtB family transcription factor [Desulfobulbaceae bacterium]HIJ78783.1 winged helix-turn-helix transcriptional regulator [Deltaproteobacteria bacterium]